MSTLGIGSNRIIYTVHTEQTNRRGESEERKKKGKIEKI
jgi:hypothetical protein